MTTTTAPTGTAPTGTGHGQMRWWVARDYLRPTRFGELGAEGIVWAVRPVLGQGADRRSIGGPTYFTSRLKALNFARAQARRIYGTPRNRKEHP